MSLLLRPLFEKESATCTYLLADSDSLEAVIIDPVNDTVSRDVTLIEQLGWRLKYIIDTHIHADHITSACPLKRRYPEAQIAVSEYLQADCIDIPLKDNQQLSFGQFTLHAWSTPGHTPSCMSFIIDDKVFTGDCLLIRSCGRCDFQDGCAQTMYRSIQRLFTLPPETLVYPAHDYNGHTVSTIGEEQLYNELIGNQVTCDEFVKRINAMNLSIPKNFHAAIAANKICGAEQVV